MKILLILSSLLVAVSAQNCLCGQENTKRRVIDGKEAERGRYPWMVLFFAGDSACGGSIINDRYILTAAHCFPEGRFDPTSVEVHVGAHDMRALPQPLRVSNVIMHSQYNRNPRFDHHSDIALIKLATPLRFNGTFNPICLGNFEPTQELHLTGWGLIRRGTKLGETDILQEGMMKLKSVDQCKRTFGSTYDATTVFCAGDRVNSCSGDSGGPVSQRQDGHLYQLGIISYGIADCNMNSINRGRPDSQLEPGANTKIIAFKKWIQDNTADAQWCRPGAKNLLF